MACRSPFPPGSPAEALSKNVLQKFRLWRQATPIHLRRISPELWKAAIELSVASTVNQAARLLGLDSGQLKKRVLAAYGPNCPAFFRHRKGATPANPPSALSTCTVSIMNSPGHKDSSPQSNDGFIEAPFSASHPGGYPLLAEILSPGGRRLRLFSGSVETIIRTFLQT